MRLMILSLAVFVLSACGGSADSVETVEAIDAVPTQSSMSADKNISSQSTVKTGAAVVFTSEFAGSLSVGEMAPLVIYLKPEYSSGEFQIEIKGQEGLMVVGETEFSESFSGDYQFTHQLLVGAERAGEYYLGVVATVTTASGTQEARAFSETILVVDPAAALTEKVNQAAEGVESYLPAFEEIITH